MSSAEHTNIHRLLDQAFDGAAMNPELADLKEEIRSNLLMRIAELGEQGLSPEEASRRAFEELGDLHGIIAEFADADHGGPSVLTTPVVVLDPAAAAAGHLAAAALNKVTPRPGFVLGILLLTVAGLASLVFLVLAVGGGGAAGPAVLAALAVAVAAGIGTAWSLRQETSQNHPLPRRRALGYGASAAAAVVGLALCALAPGVGAGMLGAGIFVVLGSTVGFIWLGMSQTNRKKAWVRSVERDYLAQDRFTQDPVAAARFGIYTAVIWIVAFALFAGLSLTVGFAWSWLALLAGLAVFLLVLARMLFPAGDGRAHRPGSARGKGE